MRLVVTKSLKPGVELGKSIYNENGQVLIQSGVTLSERMINRLQEIGITFVYIKDSRADGIEVKESITQETRKKAIDTIKTEFSTMTDQGILSKSFNPDLIQKKFSVVIKNILNDIKGNREALSLLSNVYSYDSYIFTHSLNVTIYTLALAVKAGFNEKQLMEIGMGAMLHDIGKMTIPTEILGKPGKLTNEEYGIIKEHTTAGFNILRKSTSISLLTAHCAFQHHERLDGSGYPRGLARDEIHYYAKVIGIADVFDAMTSERVYRQAMLPNEGMEILFAGVETQYDKKLVEIFKETIAVYPCGLTVVLSDGRKGIVSKQNKQLTTRPVVRIIEEHGVELTNTYEVDLLEELNVTITECETRLASEKKEYSIKKL
ncbi:HD-GYP domain-containing protein [Anaerobacillus sp. MEB173]|uniref:HD-GYP domain-containing protein n=1 Tax=Anaerobacillus sp. MEB173 TaxID=3383345 RepID=UPI003F9233FA